MATARCPGLISHPAHQAILLPSRPADLQISALLALRLCPIRRTVHRAHSATGCALACGQQRLPDAQSRHLCHRRRLQRVHPGIARRPPAGAALRSRVRRESLPHRSVPLHSSPRWDEKRSREVPPPAARPPRGHRKWSNPRPVAAAGNRRTPAGFRPTPPARSPSIRATTACRTASTSSPGASCA